MLYYVFFAVLVVFFFFKQKTAYEMRISDWSSDVCSSDLRSALSRRAARAARQHRAGDGPGLRPGTARARAAPGRAGDAVLRRRQRRRQDRARDRRRRAHGAGAGAVRGRRPRPPHAAARRQRGEPRRAAVRSEEQTSELQSLLRISYAVYCLKQK